MPSKLFVLVPVYNEKDTVVDVLSRLSLLYGTVEEILVVDDGSSDGSGELIDRWAHGSPRSTVLRHGTNRGYSQALLTGFTHLVARLQRGEVSEQDVVATLDADGQHDPSELPGLFGAMKGEDLDVVWGQRDFSLYPRWKRLGNWLMSRVARLFSGYPFKDVESGYCLFRLGPLATALTYRTRDSRYSISVTLAVILTRLGYRLSNDLKVSVPVYRSRTRLRDALADVLAAANAWAAVAFAPLRNSRQAKYRFAVAVAAVLAVTLMVSLVAAKSIFLGTDSINSYVHVWFISDSLYHTGSIPLRIPFLEGGEALTYPYGYFPWSFAAIFYPALADYAVTGTMLLGFVLMLLVVYKTRLRSDPWLFVLFLLNPILLLGLLSFQLPFIWAAVFGYLYIDAVERNRPWRAWLWWILALTTHLLMMGPILAIYAVFVWSRYKQRRGLVLGVALLSLPIIAPVVWYTLQTPSVGGNSPIFLVLTTALTLIPRGILFFFPFILVRARGILSGRLVGLGGAAFLALIFFSITIPFGTLSNLAAHTDDTYKDFLESGVFSPGAKYRILEASDREQGHYLFVKQGAVLSQELFSESQVRISWTPATYRCFLTAKRVDYVVVNHEYNRMFHTNEQRLLEEMAGEGLSRTHYADPRGKFTVYDVREAWSGAPLSVRSCFVG